MSQPNMEDTKEEELNLMGRIGSAFSGAALGKLKDEGMKVAEIITKGPKSLTAMCLIGGLLTTLSGLIGVLNVLSPFDMLASAYLFFFGITMVFLEVHEKIGYLDFLYKSIQHWMRALTTIWGRSLFYLYVGSLFLSKWTFFGILLGTYLCACGVFTYVTGKSAAQKLQDAAFEMSDMEQGSAEFLKHKFDEFDPDGSGMIDAKELQKLLQGLGQHLSKPELDSALGILDTNGSGKIDFLEFKDWLSSRDLNFV